MQIMSENLDRKIDEAARKERGEEADGDDLGGDGFRSKQHLINYKIYLQRQREAAAEKAVSELNVDFKVTALPSKHHDCRYAQLASLCEGGVGHQAVEREAAPWGSDDRICAAVFAGSDALWIGATSGVAKRQKFSGSRWTARCTLSAGRLKGAPAGLAVSIFAGDDRRR